MFRKLIAIALALMINAAVLVWFPAWSANSGATADPAGKVLTLPTITVQPTRAQIDALRRERMSPATSSLVPADAGMRTLVMPFYSFAPAGATESVG